MKLNSLLAAVLIWFKISDFSYTCKIYKTLKQNLLKQSQAQCPSLCGLDATQVFLTVLISMKPQPFKTSTTVQPLVKDTAMLCL